MLLQDFALYRWLQRVITPETSELELGEIVEDSRIDSANKQIVIARLEARRQGYGWLRLDVIKPGTGAFLAYHDKGWYVYVRLIHERYQSIEESIQGYLGEDISKVFSQVQSQLSDPNSRVANARLSLFEARDAETRRGDLAEYIASRVETFIADTTRELKAECDAAIKAADGARQACIAQFRTVLQQRFASATIDDFVLASDHGLRQQLEDIKKAYEQEIEEEKERTWWGGADTQPIEAVIAKLDRVPSEAIERVLALLLQLPLGDRHLHNQHVQEFLSRFHDRVVHYSGPMGPLAITYISRLVAERKDHKAKQLLRRFQTASRSPGDSVAAYLDYVISKPEGISGETNFRDLSPEDLFLAACYYRTGIALPTLEQQSKWDFDSLMRALSAQGDRALNDFKVKGLQPRIAELAFRSVYSQLEGEAAARLLRDRNREYIDRLDRPWNRGEWKKLPNSDWIDVNGREYDVKCNLFYPSQSDKVGMRGFFISKIKQCGNVTFPGFVFTAKEKDSCKWVYIGDYQPIRKMKVAEDDRVPPFYFCLPDSQRCRLPINAYDAQVGRLLLCNHRLQLAWILATESGPQSTQESADVSTSLLYEFVQRCLTIMKESFLEYALWKAITETTLEACNKYDAERIQVFLERAAQFLNDRALPICLPCDGGETLLGRWIREVLFPLSANWHRIRWPSCTECAPRAGVPSLNLTRITAEGTLHGRMTCKRCRADLLGEVTILTHCHRHGCHHYPLIIGKNPLCTCRGLVCDSMRNNSVRCKSCKIDCGEGQQTPEDFFDVAAGLNDQEMCF
jgi:hypothetical protein